ncbi:M81 family metallopeptidase [Paramicrobacterium chengjingii]|uniref:M81 family metallopeptidase n=1 Tax=Paramicrobacterium chengjingii TaxID=2769067 RepID=UPI00141EB951|nr:M81 family metallopeptidase [Microbacterium chengjingii]
MRVLLTEFRQESNSFSPVESDLRFWQLNGWTLEASELYAKHKSEESALGGMISVLESPESFNVELRFGPAFYTQSGGPVTQDVIDAYWSKLKAALADAEHLDAILISFHGALQSQRFDDVEAEIVRQVREKVGDSCVIGASTDLHGYISERLIDSLDVLCGYQTYPHVDLAETGARTARLVLSVLNGEEFHCGYAAVPMMVSAASYTTNSGPFKELITRAQAMVVSGRLRDFSIYQMQPWLDIDHPNSTVVVYAATSDEAQNCAGELADELYGMRHDLTADVHTISAIAERAASSESHKPVILVDSADSSNAGAPGDSAAVLDVLMHDYPQVRAATIIADPAAADAAFAAGIGSTESFSLGGTVDPRAPRVQVHGFVRSLHDGTFIAQGVGSVGSDIDLGRAAVIRVGNVDVLVCHAISGNGDPQLYRAFGIDQQMYDLVVVKANTSYKAGYESIAGESYLADSPGAAASNLLSLNFTKSNLAVYPWVDDEIAKMPVLLRKVSRKVGHGHRHNRAN